MGINTSIPIVYITDNNYTMPTVVSITSLLKNRKQTTNYKIYVIGANLEAENKQKINSLDIEFLDLDNRYENLNLSHPWASKTTLFKYDIAEFFNNYDKILYLDSDTIVTGDLSAFFNTDIENCYAGVVKDCVGEIIFNYHKKLNLKNYFNAGIMLLNIKKMREENLKEKLNNNLNLNADGCFEQDAFNVVFGDYVKYLHPDYNFMTSNFKLLQSTVRKFYNTNAINPLIVHYTHFKPWEFDNIKYSKLWKKYYNMSSYKNKKLNLKKNPQPPVLYKKQPFNDRWVIDFLGLRFSYKKGGRDFRIFYP